MYGQQDLQKISRQVIIVITLVSVIFIASLVVAIIVAANKSQWLGQLILILGVMIDIFIWGVKATPALTYQGFIKEIMTGLSRHERGRVISISREPVYKDNRLFYYEVLIQQEEENRRMLLLDVYKGVGELHEGSEYDFQIHGNYIIDFKPIA